MRKLVSKFANSLVLIIGSSSCKDVAEAYGFQKVVTTEELHARFPTLWPLGKPNPSIQPPQYDFEKEPFRAVLTFYDSPDWGRDIQIATDVLRSRNGILGTLGGTGVKNGKQLGFHQSVELHFSNPDFVWAAEWPVNRFAQGAFRMSLFHLFEALTGQTLRYTQYGKPEMVTYDYAREVIEDVARTVFKEESHGRKHHGLGASTRRVFMVGDNPHSDITGAVRSKWTGMLVRTGVFQGDTDALKMYPPNHIADNVEEAVKIALKEEGLL
jgi:HAD superfamily hydrolase (TIGR01456 family)